MKIEYDEYALEGVAKVVCKHNPSIYGCPGQVIADMKAMAELHLADGKAVLAGTGGWYVVGWRMDGRKIHVTAVLAHYLIKD